ncbi:MAG: monovalent cation/H(+) antiporter subunit G [Rhodospirillales bacterium]|nr:monovalent cation/H(+) antiporter subunit G [Rhodospirillales bacterium]
MSALVVDFLSWILLLAGTAFALTGAIGIIRLPDVFARMHGAGMIDTLGAALILLGLMLQAGPTLVTVKLLLIGVFLFFTSPATTFALARAALAAGIEPAVEDKTAGGTVAKAAEAAAAKEGDERS